MFVDALSSPGIVGVDGQPGTPSWGDVAIPAHFYPLSSDQVPVTLSLWEDLESVAAFAYRGSHGEALAHRSEWFPPLTGPPYVAWWVPDDHVPNYEEACTRWTILQEQGATSEAFDLKAPFDAEGRPARLNRERLKARQSRLDHNH